MAEHRIPIQPFDDRLRDRIGGAIIDRFEAMYELHGNEADYDPDTCWAAADDVIAVLVSELLGVEAKVAPQRVVGRRTLVVDTDKAPA